MKLSKNSFKRQLEKKGYANSTINSYVKSLEDYELWCKQKLTKENERDSSIAFRYLKHIKKKSSNPSTINGAIHPIKMYYRMFRKNNPFEYIHFKRAEQKVKDNSFSRIEVEEIYNNAPEATLTDIRDKVLLGLYVFQGIKSIEVKTIEITDFDLSGYTLLLKGGNRINQRKLGLNIKQILLLSQYININRKEILNGIKTDVFIVTAKEVNCVESVIWQLSKKLKKSTYGFENFIQIRGSVIRYWLEQFDLRKVQYLCGHRYISSTERFIVQDIKELKKDVDKFFPLD